jgi:hypothetical protein
MKLRKVPVPSSLTRTVYCPLCSSSATLKPTNTLKTMLRCDYCKVLIFANGELSQQKLKMLQDVKFNYNNNSSNYPVY